MGPRCTTPSTVPNSVKPPSDIRFDFTSHRIDDPSRNEIESFISRSYIDNFDAKLASFLPILVSGQRPGGQVNLAFGLSPASCSPLFLESYLNEPVETVLSQQIGKQVNRSEIVELGNLAFDALMTCVGTLLPSQGTVLIWASSMWSVPQPEYYACLFWCQE